MEEGSVVLNAEQSFFLDRIPRDVLISTLLLLDLKSLINCSSSSKELKLLADNDNLWKYHLNKDYPNAVILWQNKHSQTPNIQAGNETTSIPYKSIYKNSHQEAFIAKNEIIKLEEKLKVYYENHDIEPNLELKDKIRITIKGLTKHYLLLFYQGNKEAGFKLAKHYNRIVQREGFSLVGLDYIPIEDVLGELIEQNYKQDICEGWLASITDRTESIYNSSDMEIDNLESSFNDSGEEESNGRDKAMSCML